MYLTLALLAGFVLLWTAVAGRLEKTSVSAAMVYTAFGLIFGPSVLGVLDLRLEGEVVELLAELTLAILLFVDAAHADLGVIRKSYGILVRLLLVGLPLTILAGFGVGTVLFANLGWVEVALLATMLAPTDAALGKPVVSNEQLPEKVRANLNFESGLNDGICVPILLFFLLLARPPAGEALTTGLMLELFVEEVGIGAAVGVGFTLVAGQILRGAAVRGWITDIWARVLTAAFAITCFALAQWLGGSGLIAAFVGGLTFGTLAKKRKAELLQSGEVFGETFTLLTWVAFGAAVVGPALNLLTWQIFLYAALSLTVVRMVPVALALMGSDIRADGKLFMGWFGPRGLASVVFAIMVAHARLPGGDVISVAVAVTVVASIVAHGITAVPLAAAYARRTNPSV